MSKYEKMKSCFSGLERLILYRNLLEDKVLRSVNYLITGREETSIEKTAPFFKSAMTSFWKQKKMVSRGSCCRIT